MSASANPFIHDSGEAAAKSPFALENESAYRAWRKAKLEQRQRLDASDVFALDSDGQFPRAALAALEQQIEAFNFIVFESCTVLDKPAFVELNRQLGLERLDVNLGADEDGITSLYAVDPDDERAAYIPYTNRAMNWHTDGYYNPDGQRISAFALYCINPAARGGDNYLFDHEYMYLLIRDQSAELIEALMSPDLMRIPANIEGNRVIRGEQSGPVFYLDGASGALQMRYTSRPRNIVWKSDKRSSRALNLVREILMDSDALIDIGLQKGQGLICNNILHGRQAYHDDSGYPVRLFYRARYYDAMRLPKEVRVAAGSGE